MALSDEQVQNIIALVKVGGKSNVQIGKEVGCGESAVRTTVKKYNVIKNEIKDLALLEVHTIVKEDEVKKTRNEIKTRKNDLSIKEQNVYNDVFIDLKTSLGIFNDATTQNQYLVNQIQASIASKEELTTEDIFDVGALSKITEGNRKQILGATTSFTPAPEKDLNKVKSGVGELYKAIGE